ncbi:MAG: acyl-phosphate glycerol 3-phosphate acyltransferase [Candidatus Omnitrophica bacterium CG1_02_44_16]|nr:MAG: acyl-phosphate glycerol 3-phosphate acyltransferase [Candidatus Omnitrophica bacterium CG1_02_44_16]
MDEKIIKLLLGIIFSYILGSIPVAYIFGKITKGIDLRQHGSGNLGATNAFRILGRGTGAIVLALDILKGALAVLLAKYIFYQSGALISENLFLCLCAITTVSGHNWTIFLGFKGGKGIATSLGALIAFAIIIDRFVWVVVSIIFLWLIIFIPTGIVSLASVISSICLPVIAIFLNLPKEIAAFLIILCSLSMIRHNTNIRRLLQKNETRFNTRNFFSKLFK